MDINIGKTYFAALLEDGHLAKDDEGGLLLSRSPKELKDKAGELGFDTYSAMTVIVGAVKKEESYDLASAFIKDSGLFTDYVTGRIISIFRRYLRFDTVNHHSDCHIYSSPNHDKVYCSCGLLSDLSRISDHCDLIYENYEKDLAKIEGYGEEVIQSQKEFIKSVLQMPSNPVNDALVKYIKYTLSDEYKKDREEKKAIIDTAKEIVSKSG